MIMRNERLGCLPAALAHRVVVATASCHMRAEDQHEPPNCAPGNDMLEVMPAVYQELRRLAGRFLRREQRPGHTLQTTALAHEAYLRLANQRREHWLDRAGFCAAAAQAIRRILIDHARRRARRKRGGPGAQRVHLDAAVLETASSVIDVLALDEALSRLAGLAPRQARVVELRYFGGLTDDETAAVLGVSRRTVQTDWRGARAWLYRELGGDADRGIQ